jgi:hypothetical protein
MHHWADPASTALKVSGFSERASVAETGNRGENQDCQLEFYIRFDEICGPIVGWDNVRGLSAWTYGRRHRDCRVNVSTYGKRQSHLDLRENWRSGAPKGAAAS